MADDKKVILIASQFQMDFLDTFAKNRSTTKKEFLEKFFSPYDIVLEFQTYYPHIPEIEQPSKDYRPDMPTDVINQATEKKPDGLIVDPLGYLLMGYEKEKIIGDAQFHDLVNLLGEQKMGAIITVFGADTNTLSKLVRTITEKIKISSFVSLDNKPEIADFVANTVKMVYRT